MAVDLDPILEARLNTIDRQPEIEVISSEFYGAIPFQGNSFGIAGSSTFRPQLIDHSTGRLGQIYIDDNGDLQWMYTTRNKAQWTTVALTDLNLTGNSYWEYASAVELANGYVGLVLIANIYSNNRKLYYATIQVTGEVSTSYTQIEDLNDSYQWRNPYVTLLESGTYYLVYIREDPDTAWAIYARTCTTWGSWGSASDITPGGLNTGREIDNPSLYETAEGELFLLVDHVTAVQDNITIKNIFSSISTDDGSSWGGATARTTYTAYGSNGLDPIMVQRSNGTVWLIFYERLRVLHMDNTATGFSSCANCGDYGVRQMHCDYANGKLYVAFGNIQMGIKCVTTVAVIDMLTWSIDKCYHNTSTPALNLIYCENHISYEHMHGDGKYFCICIGSWGGVSNGGHSVVTIIDHTVDSVTNYVIDDLSYTAGGPTDGIVPYNLPRNVAYNSNAKWGFMGIGIGCVRVDATRDRVYMGWDGGYYREYMMFSYIDLTDTPDGEGFYDMTWLTSETSGITVPGQNRAWYEIGWAFHLDRDRGYLVCYTSGYPGHTGWTGGMAIITDTTNAALVKYYTIYSHDSCPEWGVTAGKAAIVYDGCLYGSINYYDQYPHTDQRGLCKLDYVTDTFTYYRPTWVTADDYDFRDVALDEDGGYLYFATGYGIAKFNILSGAFTLFNSDTVEGFVRSGESDSMFFVQYDPTNGNVIMGGINDYITNYLTGIGMFNENGAYFQLKFITGDQIGTATWEWQDMQDLSYYSTEANPSAIIGSDNVLWVVWRHVDWLHGQNVLYWDNDQGEIGISDDLYGTVTLNWAMKRVNTLEFTLANGYLYDPQNLLSTRNVVGQKGRKTIVRIGENIGGYTYWVNQGVFVVDSIQMSYSRGKHPMLRVSCVGKTGLWKEQQIPVSQLYGGSMPDDVIVDIITRHTQLLSTEYDIPVLDDEHTIYYQWLDKSVWDMIEEICDHFFYNMFEDANGVFTVRKVSLTQDVDHEYTDQTQITDFSPDDNYSSYTNRVRVIGESNDYTEVVHEEEMITTRSGTVGWWIKGIDETVYYDEDQERKCRTPRLEVKENPKLYGMLTSQLASGQGGIYISHEDAYEQYVTIHIDIPDLTGAVAGAIGAMLAAGIAALGCDRGWGFSGNCGLMIMLLSIAVGVVFYLLSAMANYQYELWAHPLGKVKLTIQYEANDLEMQRKLNGEIVTEEFTDALCYSVGECRRVAEGNLDLIRTQRRRLKFSKLYHLQDELLDKIKVYHPYSGEGMEILVVGLRRVYTKGSGVIDTIEGWRYIP